MRIRSMTKFVLRVHLPVIGFSLVFFVNDTGTVLKGPISCLTMFGFPGVHQSFPFKPSGPESHLDVTIETEWCLSLDSGTR
jgi:hypothetical protein